MKFLRILFPLAIAGLALGACEAPAGLPVNQGSVAPCAEKFASAMTTPAGVVQGAAACLAKNEQAEYGSTDAQLNAYSRTEPVLTSHRHVARLRSGDELFEVWGGSINGLLIVHLNSAGKVDNAGWKLQPSGPATPTAR